jgi:hypothetical protein
MEKIVSGLSYVQEFRSSGLSGKEFAKFKNITPNRHYNLLSTSLKKIERFKTKNNSLLQVKSTFSEVKVAKISPQRVDRIVNKFFYIVVNGVELKISRDCCPVWMGKMLKEFSL